MKLSTPEKDNRKPLKIFVSQHEGFSSVNNTDDDIVLKDSGVLGRQIRTKKKKKKKRFSAARQKFWQNVLTGAIVFMSIILALVFAWFVFVQPMINRMLKDINGGTIQEFMTLFNEVQATVTHTDMTDSNKMLATSQRWSVYYNAALRAENSGLDVFNDSTYNIDVNLVSDEMDFEDFYFTDLELCAVLHKMVDQIALQINSDILNYVSTTFQVWQVSLYEEDDDVRMNIVVELDLKQLKARVGTVNIFIPEKAFVVWDAKVGVETNTQSDSYGNLTFSDEKISLNKLSNRSLEILLNMLKSGIPNSHGGLDFSPSFVSSIVGGLFEDGILLVSQELGASLTVEKNMAENSYWFKLSKQ